MRNRNVHVQLWLSQREADALSRSAAKCNLTHSAFLRHLIMGYAPQEAPPPDYHAMMRQLYGVANNLNQVARKAHALHVIDAQKVDECQKQVNEAILQITEAVVLPRKMNKEEWNEQSSN